MSLFLFHHRFFFILLFPFLSRIGYFLLCLSFVLQDTALLLVSAVLVTSSIDLFLFCFVFDHRVLLLFLGFLSRVTKRRSRFWWLMGSTSSNNSSRWLTSITLSGSSRWMFGITLSGSRRWLICSTLISRRRRLIRSTLSSRRRWLIRSQLSGRSRIYLSWPKVSVSSTFWVEKYGLMLTEMIRSCFGHRSLLFQWYK